MIKKTISLLLLISVLVSASTIAQLSIDDFIREPDYLGAEISPNGQYLAELWNRHEDNMRIVTIKDLTQANRPIIGTLSDKLIRPFSITWANNERLLIWVSVPYETSRVRRLMEKQEDFDLNDHFKVSRLFAVDPDSSNVVMLFNDLGLWKSATGSLSTINHYLPDDPNHVLLYGPSTGVYDGKLSLYKVNIYDGSSDLLIQGGPNTYGFISDIIGNPLFRFDYKSTFTEVQIFDVSDPDNQRFIQGIDIYNEEDDLAYGDILGVLGTKLLYIKKNEDSGYRELWSYDGETTSFEPMISLPDKDIIGVLISKHTAQAMGYVVDELHGFKFFDEEMQKNYNLSSNIFPNHFTYASNTQDSSKAIIQSVGRDDPGTYSIYNLKEDTLTPLPDAFWALTNDKLSIPVNTSYLTRDGIEIESFVLFPNSYI